MAAAASINPPYQVNPLNEIIASIGCSIKNCGFSKLSKIFAPINPKIAA